MLKLWISLTDLILKDESNFEIIHPDLLLTGNEVLKTVKPFDEFNTSIAYLADKKLENYSLILTDPLDGKEVIKIPLEKKRNWNPLL